jgi:hypothetical protein
MKESVAETVIWVSAVGNTRVALQVQCRYYHGQLQCNRKIEQRRFEEICTQTDAVNGTSRKEVQVR